MPTQSEAPLTLDAEGLLLPCKPAFYGEEGDEDNEEVSNSEWDKDGEAGDTDEDLGEYENNVFCEDEFEEEEVDDDEEGREDTEDGDDSTAKQVCFLSATQPINDADRWLLTKGMWSPVSQPLH